MLCSAYIPSAGPVYDRLRDCLALDLFTMPCYRSKPLQCLLVDHCGPVYAEEQNHKILWLWAGY